MKTRVLVLVAFLGGLTGFGGALAADEDAGEPLWEVGIGAAGGWIPDYPAAGENSFKGLPFPYAVYRGDVWRVGDREIVAGRLLRRDWYEFDVSLDGAFPVDSDDNKDRSDMPDLDFLIGVGPELKFKLMDNPGRDKLELKLQARAVFSVDFFSTFVNRGYVLHPRLAYEHNDFAGLKTRFRTNVGPIFATNKLMKYFYEVKPRFATASRPEFDTDGGYLGTELNLSFSKKLNKKFRSFIGTRVGVYTGATNDDSPLFRDEVTVGVFGGFIWSIWQSEQPAAD